MKVFESGALLQATPPKVCHHEYFHEISYRHVFVASCEGPTHLIFEIGGRVRPHELRSNQSHGSSESSESLQEPYHTQGVSLALEPLRTKEDLKLEEGLEVEFELLHFTWIGSHVRLDQAELHEWVSALIGHLVFIEGIFFWGIQQLLACYESRLHKAKGIPPVALEAGH